MPRKSGAFKNTMMADIKDVYIPLCKNGACEIKLKKLADLVTNCRTDHKLTGTYASWFEHHFTYDPVTVIHLCPVLWGKIKIFEEKLKKSVDKIILLNLDVEEFSHRHQSDDMDSVTNFFNDIGSARLVSTEDELQDFAQIVQDFVRENGEQTGFQEDKSFPQSNPLSEASSLYTRNSEGAANSESEPYDGPLQPHHSKYPSIFGQTDHHNVFIRSDFLPDSSQMLNIFSPGKSSLTGNNINNLNKSLSPDQVLSNNSYISGKILPNIYNHKDILALVSVCTCNYPELQKRALILLELCLWEDKMGDPHTNMKNLFDTECTLYTVLEILTKKHAQTKDEAYLALLDRASNVYLMILSAIVMCNSDKEMNGCSKYLRTIRSRRQSSSQVHQEAKEYMDKCDDFIKDSDNFLNVATKVRSKISNLAKEENSILNKLPSKSCIFQVVFTFEMLKKVFSSDPDEKAQRPKFLCNYIHKQKRLLLDITWKERSKSVCTVMVLRALTLLVKHHSLHNAHMELKEQYETIINSLAYWIQSPERRLYDEVMRLLHSLPFHSNCVIRSETSRILNKKKSLTTQSFLEEIVDILDPLLSLDRSHAYKESTWLCCRAKFGCESVSVFYHVMKERYFKDTKVVLENHKDVNSNEMYSLMNLQNEHIIPLFAFQRCQVPCFYVIGDPYQNLQTVMQNLQKNGMVFSHLELCQLLMDVVSALQYCHDKNWIHRNLTATSLAYHDGKRVKLGSFGLCEKLGPSHKVLDLDNQNIPFRWSAPESIFKSVYSKPSDIWMMGVLIYEVMTHGVTPFLGFTDSNLWERMKEQSAHLSKEKCFDEGMYHLMIECTRYEPESRPYIENVKTTIEKVMGEHSSNPRTVDKYPYPEFTDDRLSIISRGVPLHLRYDSLYSGMVYALQISEILARGEKMNGEYVFQETVVHTMPPAVLSIFDWESFKQIFTQEFHLHLAHEKRHSTSQYIYSTVNMSSSLLSEIQEGGITNLQTLLEVVYEVALKLSKMADLDLVLGDLYPNAVYVDKQNHRKVYIISFAFMKKTTLTDYSNYTARLPPIPDFMVYRAAPRVFKENDFSPMSDVYCFGSFVWEALAAFYKQPLPLMSMSPNEIKAALGRCEWQNHNTRPPDCPDKIYQLVKLCVSHEAERPPMKHVVMKLQEYYKELYNADLAPSDSPSANDSVTLCSQQESSPRSMLTSEINPSTMKDSTYESIDDSHSAALWSQQESSPRSMLTSEINPSTMKDSTYESIDDSHSAALWSQHEENPSVLTEYAVYERIDSDRSSQAPFDSPKEGGIDLTQVKMVEDDIQYIDAIPTTPPNVPDTAPPPLLSKCP